MNKLSNASETSEVDLVELYTEPTYDDLKEALSNYLNPNSDDTKTTTSNGVTASTTPTKNVATATDTKETADVADAFDELFNN